MPTPDKEWEHKLVRETEHPKGVGQKRAASANEEDVRQEVFLRIWERARNGKPVPNAKFLGPYVGATLRNVRSSMRGRSKGQDPPDIRFRREVEDGRFSDTPEGRRDFDAMDQQQGDRRRAEALPLREDLCMHKEENPAYQYATTTLLKCIETHDPDSILLRKYRDGMTYKQIAESEQRRCQEDAALGFTDPGGYLVTSARVRRACDKAATKWSTRQDVLTQTANEMLDELGVLAQEELMEEIRKHQTRQ